MKSVVFSLVVLASSSDEPQSLLQAKKHDFESNHIAGEPRKRRCRAQIKNWCGTQFKGADDEERLAKIYQKDVCNKTTVDPIFREKWIKDTLKADDKCNSEGIASWCRKGKCRDTEKSLLQTATPGLPGIHTTFRATNPSGTCYDWLSFKMDWAVARPSSNYPSAQQLASDLCYLWMPLIKAVGGGPQAYASLGGEWCQSEAEIDDWCKRTATCHTVMITLQKAAPFTPQQFCDHVETNVGDVFKVLEHMSPGQCSGTDRVEQYCAAVDARVSARIAQRVAARQKAAAVAR